MSRTDGNTSTAPAPASHFTLIEQAVPVLPDRPLLIALRWNGEPGVAPPVVDARTDDGRTMPLPVRRLGARPRQPNWETAWRFSQWRWAAPPFEFFDIDDASNQSAVVYLLLLEDPDAWPGVGLNVGAERVVLVPAEPDPDEPSCSPLAGTSGFDEPDADSPLDAARRALWRRHVNPDAPDVRPDPQSALALLGRQTSGRWLAALRDLTLIDPALSLDLQRLLVRTARDGPTRFAAWPASTAELSELESLLMSRLTESPGDEDWRLRVKSWMANQPDAVPWIESDSGLYLSLACANLTTTAQQAQMSDARRPLIWGLELAPSSVGRTMVNRYAESLSQRVIVQTASTNRTLALLDDHNIVLPPGLPIDNFWRAWSLDTWLAGRPSPADPDRKTAALIRRSPETQQWELMITCTLKEPLDLAPAGGPDQLSITDSLADWHELIGRESITILFGFFNQPFEVLSILPDGTSRAWRRSNLLLPPNVKVQVFPDHWQATIALSSGVVGDLQLQFGLVRMHDGRDGVDCFPRPALPWKHDPGRIQVDLSRWDALPTPAEDFPVSPAADGE